MSNPSAPPAYDVAVNEDKKVNPQYAHAGYQTTGNSPYPPTYAQNPPPQIQADDKKVNPQYAHAGYQTTGNPPYPLTYAQNPPPQIQTVNAQPSYQSPPSNSADVGGFTTGQSFDDKSVRRIFIRKVFAILSVQLLITFGFVCLFRFVPAIGKFVQNYPGFYYASYGVFLVLYLILICCTSAARNYPCNIIMLFVLTLALSYMVGTITTFNKVEAVLIAVGVTAVVCITVMLFSIQTKFDFTKCGGLLFILMMVLFVFGFITIFTYSRSYYVQVIYGCLGALVFTLFLAFDTQLVMGGRKYELSPEEYVFGALSLYIDIVYIFIFLLSIFGGSN